MAIDERRKEEMTHKITLLRREKMSVTGVEDVESFDDDNITLYTVEGILTIKGANLKINRLCVEDGELEVEGEIDSIVYSNDHRREKTGILSKIFK